MALVPRIQVCVCVCVRACVRVCVCNSDTLTATRGMEGGMVVRKTHEETKASEGGQGGASERKRLCACVYGISTCRCVKVSRSVVMRSPCAGAALDYAVRSSVSGRFCACACVRACVCGCASARMCVRACVGACGCGCVGVRA
jgi:hypothetical protein